MGLDWFESTSPGVFFIAFHLIKHRACLVVSWHVGSYFARERGEYTQEAQ